MGVFGLLLGCDAAPDAAMTGKGAEAALCASTTTAASSSGYLAQPNTTLDQDIEHLVRMTGGAVAGQMVADALLDQLPERFPEAPPEFWAELAKQLRPDDFVAIVVPIYAKHFTQDEIRQMIAFNETPVGAKFMKVSPAVQDEASRAADEWGTEMGVGIVADLRAAGYAPAPPPRMPIPGAPTVP